MRRGAPRTPLSCAHSSPLRCAHSWDTAAAPAGVSAQTEQTGRRLAKHQVMHSHLQPVRPPQILQRGRCTQHQQPPQQRGLLLVMPLKAAGAAQSWRNPQPAGALLKATCQQPLHSAHHTAAAALLAARHVLTTAARARQVAHAARAAPAGTGPCAER